MPFQLGLSGGLSHTKGGRRKLTNAFKSAGVIKPPAGTYDPGLDAGLRAAGRGYQDFAQDTERDGERASSAYLTGTTRLGEDRDFEMGGLDISDGRINEDFGRLSGRLTQDYGRQTEGLQRTFKRLGNAQGQAGAQAGLTGGGFAAQAAKKRAENQGLEQRELDIGRDRGMEDLTLGRDRGLADNTRSRGRMATLFGREGEDLGTNFQYGQSDRATGLARAGRENTFYGQDVSDQRYFQAGQSGWSPPAAPKKKKKGKR